MHQERPYCLSIAGFDPSGGAGILSDIKTFEQLGVYGLGVASAITFQNDNSFEGLKWCSLNTIESQIQSLKKYRVKTIKIGLIENLEILESLIGIISKAFGDTNIIWDPILKATAGFKFHNHIKLGPILTENILLITPNESEYAKIDGAQQNKMSVLIKGGHAKKRGTDILLTGQQKIKIEGKPFERSIDKHGTGCVLSSAIAAFLAKDFSLEDSCRNAKKYTEQFILSTMSNLGYHS